MLIRRRSVNNMFVRIVCFMILMYKLFDIYLLQRYKFFLNLFLSRRIGEKVVNLQIVVWGWCLV